MSYQCKKKSVSYPIGAVLSCCVVVDIVLAVWNWGRLIIYNNISIFHKSEIAIPNFQPVAAHC